MQDVAYTPINPLDTTQKVVNIAQGISSNALTQQNTANAAITGQQLQSNLTNQLKSDLGNAWLSHALYGEQTPAAYRQEIDNQIAGKPQLAALGAQAKASITDDMTPEQLKMIAMQHASAMLSPTVQTQLAPNGQVQFINNGGSQVPVRMPGGMGTAVQGATPSVVGQGTVGPGGIPNTLTPGEYSTRVPAIGQGGQAGTVPLGSMPGSVVSPQPGAPAYPGPVPRPGAVKPPAVNIPSPSNPPRLPGAVQPPQPSQAANGNPPGFVPTALPPGSQQNIDAAGQRLAQDTDALTQYPTRVQPLLEAIKVAPNAGSGPGSEKLNQIASFLQSRGINVGLTPDMSSTAAYDLLTKNLQRYTNGLPLANQSQDGLASAISGNPHASMTSLGLHDSLVQTLAMERMQAALRKGYTGPLDGPSYQKYLTDQSTKIDPRAFVQDQLSTDSQHKMFAGMTRDEQDKFIASRNLANSTGVMTNNSFAPPGQ